MQHLKRTKQKRQKQKPKKLNIIVLAVNKKKNEEGKELTLEAEYKPKMKDSPPFLLSMCNKTFALLFQLGQINNIITLCYFLFYFFIKQM